jgi:hypothetical protein
MRSSGTGTPRSAKSAIDCAFSINNELVGAGKSARRSKRRSASLYS